MTYTEEQVNELIQVNLKLSEENTKLQEQLYKESLQRECAEKRYSDLCERCMSFYITDRDIITDTIQVQATAPRFMTSDDFTKGISRHLITICNAEREKKIFHDIHTSRYKAKT